MKIRISEDERYEINLPEEVTIQDFQAITSKFNFLLKNFSKMNPMMKEESNDGIMISEDGFIQGNVYRSKPNGNTTETTPKKVRGYNKARWIFLENNRQAVVDIMKVYYSKDHERFAELCNRLGISLAWSDVAIKRFRNIAKKHKIKPEEVGIIRFPRKGESAKIMGETKEKIN